MRGTVFIDGDDFELRTIERDDIGWMKENINDPNIRRYTTATRPVNFEQEEKFFDKGLCEGKDQVHLKITDGEERIGLTSLMNINRKRGNAEIGLWITTENQGKGYGTKASELMTDYGFR